jgi:hypothetical protein
MFMWIQLVLSGKGARVVCAFACAISISDIVPFLHFVLFEAFSSMGIKFKRDWKRKFPLLWFTFQVPAFVIMKSTSSTSSDPRPLQETYASLIVETVE